MLPNPGGLVYGTLIVGALLAAESARRETYLETVAAVVVALLLYWLAHAYSEFTEQRLEHNQPLTLSSLGHTLASELMIVGGASVPLAALLIGWALGASLPAAVTAAVWTSVAMIVAVEVIAALRAELTGRALVVQISFGAVFGLLVIALRLILH